MVVFMLSVRVFSCMCPDCVACVVFAGFCFLGCLFLFSFVCSVGFGRSVRLVLLRWTGCVLRSGLSGLCVRDGVRLVRPCFSVWSCRPVFPAVRSCPVFLSVLVFFPSSFFSASPFCLRRLAPCGRRAPRAARGPSLFPLVFPYRRPRARRRMMRMPWYSPRAKRRMARTASRRPCARPARVVPAGEAGRRAGRRVSSGSGVVSGV